ncbi:hypothetical protein HYT25_02675 [Candidatus Pacearchaeota archaeon]|nr:hypothetical protein [Candidatus Pacearchaeota archaeon]
MIPLKCGCAIKDDGTFVLGERCKYCLECNTISEMHPFTEKRLDDLGFHNP